MERNAMFGNLNKLFNSKNNIFNINRSLGVILYYIITKRLPFDGNGIEGLFKKSKLIFKENHLLKNFFNRDTANEQILDLELSRFSKMCAQENIGRPSFVSKKIEFNNFVWCSMVKTVKKLDSNDAHLEFGLFCVSGKK